MAVEEIKKCPICNGASFSAYLTCKDYTASEQDFQVAQCTGCQFLITNPRPSKEDIGPYYQSDSYISHTGGSKNLMDKIYLIARSFALYKKRKLVQAYSQQAGSLLDYGCGTGEFIYECQKKGWNISGIEPSQTARTKAEQLNKISIASKGSELTDNQFDAITLWHVLEHIHDLDETISLLKKWLKPNGTIFIAVPNHESWDTKYYHAHWAAYDVPRHLWHFSKKNVNQLFSKHGMKVHKTLPMKLDAYYVSLLSEQYKNPNQNTLKRYLNGFLHGLKSNIKARKETNFSSLIYVIKR